MIQKSVCCFVNMGKYFNLEAYSLLSEDCCIFDYVRIWGGLFQPIPKSTLVYCNWLWEKHFVHNARIYELANWGESYFGAFSAGPVKKCTLVLLCRWFGGSILSSNEEDDDDNDVGDCPTQLTVGGATPPVWERTREIYY